MHLIALEQEPTSLRGGQELNLFEITRGLVKRGHRVSLLYERDGNLVDEYRKFCQDVIKIDTFGFDRRKVDDILKFVRSLIRIGTIPADQDSLVFCNAYHSAVFGYALSSLKHLPFICYFQIPPCDFNRQRRVALNGVDQFIAVSHQTKLEWVKFGLAEEKIEVIQNGTDPNKFKPAEDFAALRKEWGLSENDRVISYVGRIDESKGIESLIKALGILHQQGITPHLLLAGKPVVHYDPEKGRECPEAGAKYQQSLEQLAIDSGVGEQVKFLGLLKNPVPLYQISDVNVLCSTWPEPFARVILESMSCGTPIVGSRIGGTIEALTGEFERGLFTPNDEKDLARCLTEMLDWRSQEPELGARYRNHVLKHFGLEKLVENFETTLLKVAQKSKVAA
ncbi:glycosyltransferase family 4 protein [Phormidesmis sp. 146-35]